MTFDRPCALFLGPWPPPFGGIASHLHQLLPALHELGIDVVCLSYDESRADVRHREGPVELIRFSPSRHLRKRPLSIGRLASTMVHHRSEIGLRQSLRAASIADKLDRVIEEFGVDVVFTYDNDQLYPIPYLRKLRGPSLPIFATIYAAFYLTPERYRADRSFLRKAAESSDMVLSCSRYCVDSATEFLGAAVETGVIYNNVDPRVFHPDVDGSKIRRRMGIDAEAVVLSTLGRVGHDMGVDFLLENLEEILSIDRRLELVVVGAKAELCGDVVTRAATEPRLHYAFDIPLAEKQDYLAACDIFTAPTKQGHACMGIANIEAMMCGKPVIASRSGGHVETIDDGGSGYLIEFGADSRVKADSFLAKLRQLVQDDQLRRKCGVHARQRSLRLFSNAAIARIHSDIIHGALGHWTAVGEHPSTVNGRDFGRQGRGG